MASYIHTFYLRIVIFKIQRQSSQRTAVNELWAGLFNIFKGGHCPKRMAIVVQLSVSEQCCPYWWYQTWSMFNWNNKKNTILKSTARSHAVGLTQPLAVLRMTKPLGEAATSLQQYQNDPDSMSRSLWKNSDHDYEKHQLSKKLATG